MDISYHKGPSRNLGRDMEYKRYGHAGRPVSMNSASAPTPPESSN